MFSLQRLLGKEDKFFDLLEASATEAQKSAYALLKFLENPKEAKDEAGRGILRLIQLRLATLSLKKSRYAVKLNC